jgi:hypothetical protein
MYPNYFLKINCIIIRLLASNSFLSLWNQTATCTCLTATSSIDLPTSTDDTHTIFVITIPSSHNPPGAAPRHGTSFWFADAVC